MQVYLSGVDITPDTSIHATRYIDHAEARADSLTVVFNDTERMWADWNPQVDDEIRLAEGALDTKTMYIDEVKYRNGLVEIAALSIPRSAKTERYRAFEDVQLCALATEIASAHGFTAEFLNIEDRHYGYLRQNGQSDAQFLSDLAELESYAVKAYDKKFLFYSPQVTEQGAAQTEVKLTRFDTYQLMESTHSIYAECHFMTPNGPIVFADPNARGGRILKIYDGYASDPGEAVRFARGHLRRANRIAFLSHIPADLRTDISAGSVVAIKGDGVPSGNWYCWKADHDFATAKSYLHLRKPLKGY